MRSVVRLVSAVILVSGCTASVDADLPVDEPTGAIDGPSEPGSETKALNVTLPPGGLLPAPTVKPPTNLVLPPMIERFEVVPVVRSTNCLISRQPTSGPTTATVAIKVRQIERVRSVELLRNGVSIHRIDWPTVGVLGGSTFAIPNEVYDRANPHRTVTYELVATDVGGRRGRSELVYRIAPPAELTLTGPVTITGPSSGSGVRIARVPWRGYNVDNVQVNASPSGVSGTVSTSRVDPWGAATGVVEVPLSFDAARWDDWRDAGDWLTIYGQTPVAPNGCSSGATAQAVAVVVASSTPSSPPDGGTPPDSGSDSGLPTAWLPTDCAWVCDWAPYPDRVITNYERTYTQCGATTDLPRARYLMCSLASAPGGAEISICSTQSTPAGWSNVRNETRSDVCVPWTGSTTSNTRVIRKL